MHRVGSKIISIKIMYRIDKNEVNNQYGPSTLYNILYFFYKHRLMSMSRVRNSKMISF